MQLIVRCQLMSHIKYPTVEVELSDTVLLLKEKVMEASDYFPSEKGVLFLGDEILADWETLEEKGIDRESKVVLLLRRGGCGGVLPSLKLDEPFSLLYYKTKDLGLKATNVTQVRKDLPWNRAKGLDDHVKILDLNDLNPDEDVYIAGEHNVDYYLGFQGDQWGYFPKAIVKDPSPVKSSRDNPLKSWIHSPRRSGNSFKYKYSNGSFALSRSSATNKFELKIKLNLTPPQNVRVVRHCFEILIDFGRLTSFGSDPPKIHHRHEFFDRPTKMSALWRRVGAADNSGITLVAKVEGRPFVVVYKYWATVQPAIRDGFDYEHPVQSTPESGYVHLDLEN